MRGDRRRCGRTVSRQGQPRARQGTYLRRVRRNALRSPGSADRSAERGVIRTAFLHVYVTNAPCITAARDRRCAHGHPAQRTAGVNDAASRHRYRQRKPAPVRLHAPASTSKSTPSRSTAASCCSPRTSTPAPTTWTPPPPPRPHRSAQRQPPPPATVSIRAAADSNRRPPSLSLRGRKAPPFSFAAQRLRPAKPSSDDDSCRRRAAWPRVPREMCRPREAQTRADACAHFWGSSRPQLAHLGSVGARRTAKRRCGSASTFMPFTRSCWRRKDE